MPLADSELLGFAADLSKKFSEAQNEPKKNSSRKRKASPTPKEQVNSVTTSEQLRRRYNSVACQKHRQTLGWSQKMDDLYHN